MKFSIQLLAAFCLMITALTSCGDEPENPYIPPWTDGTGVDNPAFRDTPLWQRHHDSSLKILAIGNSFTINATTHMPWLIDRLNGDSVCIARLTRSGCSLQQHWENHASDIEDYELYFSDGGKWILSEIKTIDEALTIFDWNVVTIQQASAFAGLYRYYQPYLDNLVRLFRETNPEALLAWHYTWAYTPWTEHTGFTFYDRDAEKMYKAIMETCDKASEGFDLRIPSATLIKRMREEWPEVENGFSYDGFHITDDFALYALSRLWYEVTVSPFAGTSSLSMEMHPEGVKRDGMEKVEEIIRLLMGRRAGG